MAQYDILLTQNVAASGIQFQEKFVNIAKGGLLSANASSAPTILAAGTNGYVLIRDDIEVTGLKWVDPSTIGGSSDVSVTNQANNRVITATATTDVLNAESGLTYDGSVLSVTGSITQSTVRILSGASNAFTYNATTQDVRIGINAGNDAMTHTYHSVLIGSNTGYNMTTAEGCVFIGYCAGQIVSTGSYNVGIGPYALNRATTGTQNLAIGAHALRNFTGLGNVGIGYGAGMGVSGSSTGNYNMFLGASAGSGVTSGSTNVLIGASAGMKITTGGNNTIIGGTAGQYNTGSYNTFIGIGAGKGVDGSSTGGNNVFIGALSGQDVTSGQYNLLIGYHVDPSSATATYDFRLGYDTTFLLQGNMAGGSQWVGTDYVFRTDYLEEFTASAGITVQDDILVNSTNKLKFYNSASVYFTAENDSVFNLFLGNLKKFQFSQAASAAYLKFYLDPATDVYGYILVTNTDYTATYTAGPKSTGTGVGVKLYGGDTAAAGEKGGDIFIRGGISGSGGAASIVNIQSPLTLSGIASATSGNVLYYNSGVITYGAAPSGGTIDGSGAATRIAYWSDADTLTSSANLVFDGSTLTIAQGILVTAPTTNQTASGIKTTLTAGEALTFGSMVYMKNDGKVWKASASGITTTPVIGMCLNTVSANGSAIILLSGRAYNSSWSLGTGGDEIYLTTGAGGFSTSAPSGVTGYVVQVLGVVLSATTIYFNPSLNQTVLA